MSSLTIKGPGGLLLVHHLSGDHCRIGRATGADVVISDPEVSRVHLEFVKTSDGWTVTDESRNGTLLNGSPLTDRALLVPQDRLQIGHGTTIWFDAPERARGTGADRETAEVTVRRELRQHRPSLVGRSRRLVDVLELIDRVAPREATVLITGESGTGKELIAQLIHERSGRQGPFVTVNCPALPGSLFESELFGVERGVATGVDARPGFIETAAGGTVFLDEIGELTPDAQAKLLRLLQDRKFERVGGRGPQSADVRFLAATNRDLETEIRDGTFRQDLYFRLNVVTIESPPLRERAEDIPLLAEHFLVEEGGRARQLSDEAVRLLTAYDWPGNVRQLMSAMQRASILADSIVVEPEHLPPAVVEAAGATAASGSLSATIASVEDHARSLLEDVVAGRTSFDEAVKEPFKQRLLSREATQRFVELAVERGGAGYKGMAELLGIPEQHKKLLDWLRHHQLLLPRQGGRSRGDDEE